jgi:hypothetical protein
MRTIVILHTLTRHLQRHVSSGVMALTLTLALFVLALAQSPTCHLSALALLLPVPGQRENLIQRLRRWLASPRVDWERYYRPLAAQVLAEWTGAEIALVMDRTDLNDRLSVLCIGLATHHRVVLLAWEVLPYGSTDADTQIRLLERISPLLPDPAVQRIVLYGDAEFRAVDVQQYCRDHGWRWHLGVKSDTRYRTADGTWQSLRSIPIERGQRRYLQDITLTAQHAFGPVNLIIDWNPNEDAPRYWVLNQPANRHAWRRGRKRFWIEPTNRDFKSAGFDLEHRGLTDASRLSALILAMAVTWLWVAFIGQWVTQQGLRTRLEAAHKRDYSLFRLGRDWVQRALVMGWPIPVGFTVRPGSD